MRYATTWAGAGLASVLIDWTATLQPTLSSTEVAAHIGKTVTVCGKVVDHASTVRSRGVETFLYLDTPAPNATFAIRIPEGRRGAFSPLPEQTYRDRDMCVTGKVRKKDRLAYIDVKGPEQLQLRGPQTEPDEPVLRPGAEGLKVPRILREVKPHYTRDAMKARIEGIVEMEVVVLRDGTVGRIRIVRSLDRVFGLDQQAVQAVQQWRFHPGMRFGRPVAVLVTVELTFTLK